MSLKIQILLFSLLSEIFIVPTTYAESSSQIQNNEQSVVLDVQNMTCAMCKFTIKKALSSVEGTKKVSVNFEDKIAKVIFNPQKTNTESLIKAITNSGYPATIQLTKKLKTE